MSGSGSGREREKERSEQKGGNQESERQHKQTVRQSVGGKQELHKECMESGADLRKESETADRDAGK